MFVKMHKKRGKNKHIEHIHFSPFSRLSFQPCRLRRQGWPLGKVPPGKPSSPRGRPFLFLPYLFSRSIHFHPSLGSIPSLCISFRCPFASGRPSHPRGFFCRYFFLFTAAGKWLEEMGKIGDGREKMNGLRAVG